MTCKLELSQNRERLVGSLHSHMPGRSDLIRVFFFLGCAMVVGSLSAVTIADKNLETLLRALIPGSPGGELSAGDLYNITELEAYSQNIKQLGGMEYLSNLTYANLSANKNISDLSSLAGLTRLEELRLGDNAITDLGSISSLTSLKKLRLYDNLVTDLSPLKSLTKLEELWIWGNQVQDISPSKSWTNLTTYYLYGNQDWKELDWFGFFFDGESEEYVPYGPHWIYHAQHGWLYWNLSDSPYDFTSFWVWSQDLEWCWMSETVYPFIWSSKTGGWLWYLEESSVPRWFYNFVTGAWESLDYTL